MKTLRPLKTYISYQQTVIFFQLSPCYTTGTTYNLILLLDYFLIIKVDPVFIVRYLNSGNKNTYVLSYFFFNFTFLFFSYYLSLFLNVLISNAPLFSYKSSIDQPMIGYGFDPSILIWNQMFKIKKQNKKPKRKY